MTDTLLSNQEDRLYFYRSTSTEKDMDRIFFMLKQKLLHCSHPFLFNDPFDCATHFLFKGDEEAWRDYLDKCALLKPEEKDCLIEDARKFNFDMRTIPDLDMYLLENSFFSEFFMKINHLGFLKDFRVMCLTAKPDNRLMWSHYADSHKGVCFGFECKHSDIYSKRINDIGGKFHNLNRVVYQEEMPPLDFFKLKSCVENESWKSFGHDYVFTKAQDWVYEEEYRGLFNIDELVKKVEDKDVKYYFPFAEGFLKEVIFGIHSDKNKNSQKNKQDIISLVKEYSSNNGYDVKFYQARKHVNNYKVVNDRIYP